MKLINIVKIKQVQLINTSKKNSLIELSEEFPKSPVQEYLSESVS